MMLNRAEHCTVLQRPQVPVTRVFQSVAASSKRQVVRPPFEIFDHGLFDPGKLATTQPAGTAITQL
jgi:hypothetical protein